MPEDAAATQANKPLLLREPPPPGGGEIVRVDDVDRELMDQWVIMRVTAMEGGWPPEGYVVAHDRSEKRCWEKFRQAVAASEPRAALHSVFVASPRVRTRADWQLLIRHQRGDSCGSGFTRIASTTRA